MNFMPFCLGNQDIGRHVIIMVQKDMGFNATFGLPKFSPREKGQTKADSSGVEAEELVFEAEFEFTCTDDALLSEIFQRRPEKGFVQISLSVSVGLGQSRFIGGFPNPKVYQFALTTRQSVTNLSQRISWPYGRKAWPLIESSNRSLWHAARLYID